MNTSAGSPDRFSYSWNKFHDITEDQFRHFQRWTCLIEDWRDKRILDVGCGAGRNTYWALSLGAERAVCIDVDERSLAHARRNLEGLPAEIRFLSIYESQYLEAFDIVFSVGVVHHLDDQFAAVKKMRDAAKPGGLVHIWVYGRENMGFFLALADPLRRYVFSRLPLPIVDACAWVITAGLWALLRFPLRLEYWKLMKTFRFDYIKHLVLDHMLPKIATYRTRDEVIALMQDAGLRDVQVAHVNDVSWCAIGIKAP